MCGFVIGFMLYASKTERIKWMLKENAVNNRLVTIYIELIGLLVSIYIFNQSGEYELMKYPMLLILVKFILDTIWIIVDVKKLPQIEGSEGLFFLYNISNVGGEQSLKLLFLKYFDQRFFSGLFLITTLSIKILGLDALPRIQNVDALLNSIIGVNTFQYIILSLYVLTVLLDYFGGIALIETINGRKHISGRLNPHTAMIQLVLKPCVWLGFGIAFLLPIACLMDVFDMLMKGIFIDTITNLFGQIETVIKISIVLIMYKIHLSKAGL